MLTIPVEALVLRGNKEMVYVVDGENHVRERAVQVGLEGSKLAEIKSGLESGRTRNRWAVRRSIRKANWSVLSSRQHLPAT